MVEEVATVEVEDMVVVGEETSAIALGRIGCFIFWWKILRSCFTLFLCKYHGYGETALKLKVSPIQQGFYVFALYLRRMNYVTD